MSQKMMELEWNAAAKQEWSGEQAELNAQIESEPQFPTVKYQ